MEVRTKKQLDPDGSQLRGVLEAQFAYERMSSARSVLAHLLAIIGVIIWLEAIWPDLLPEELRVFTFVLWGSLLLLTVWVAVEEYVSWRKLTPHVARKGGISLHKTQKSF